MNLSSASTQYVRVPVTATASGSPHDPTGDPVYMAFMSSASATPASGDWHTGSWETANGGYYALCLVGPANGGVILAAGTYYVWVKVTDNPEVPVIQAGVLQII